MLVAIFAATLLALVFGVLFMRQVMSLLCCKGVVDHSEWVPAAAPTAMSSAAPTARLAPAELVNQLRSSQHPVVRWMEDVLEGRWPIDVLANEAELLSDKCRERSRTNP